MTHDEQPSLRVGIDVGGTFTDFTGYDSATHQFLYHKEASTPADPAHAIKRGLTTLLVQHQLAPEAIGLLSHGTTIGLNAILQRRGTEMALIVTEGYQDILAIGRGRMPSAFNFLRRPDAPIIPRHHIVEVPLRVDADGAVQDHVNSDTIQTLVQQLTERDIQTVVLLVVNSYLRPEVETELAAKLQAQAPDLTIVPSAATWPIMREYERCMVANMNAYIMPLMRRYLEDLQIQLTDLKLSAPVLITTSNGGSLSLDSAMERPIDTILSGPAAGAMAATKLARSLDLSHTISFDMGGTSSDIAIADHGLLDVTDQSVIGSYPLSLPVVEVSAIGAGGGSIAWVDPYGILKVGPESAGAEPGPAAYGRGGRDATITDCYLALNLIDPNSFLGGQMTLSAELARAALQPIADKLGYTGEHAIEQAAAGVLQVATAQMATQLQKLMSRTGRDARDYVLIPYGGAGPTHANLLAEAASINHIVVPLRPSTFCAYGAVTSDLKRDFIQTFRQTLDEDSVAQVIDVMAGLEKEARDWLTQEGIPFIEHTSFSYSMDMRYAGQAYDLTVRFPDKQAADLDLNTLRQGFDNDHRSIYGYADDASAVVVNSIRLSVTGHLPGLPAPAFEASQGSVSKSTNRQVFYQDKTMPAQVIQRSHTVVGQEIAGPAIIEQADTTIFILPHWQAVVDAAGNLHITREAVDSTIRQEAPNEA